MNRFAAVRQVFEELAELPLDRRAAALAPLRAADPALAAEVEEMLRADEIEGGPLDRPVVDLHAETDDDPDGPRAGQVMGAYRLRSRLGRGGMGEVWLAERQDGQFEQQVAIKVLKGGMDSAEVLRRFRRERQILARLEHPHIGRLYDGGVSVEGRPYFVMERIVGEPLTDYVDRNQLSVEQRVRLLATCCDAVAAAHRRFIVHRDLKPSNVLVTAEGEVKLLDFGIAKLLEGNQAGEVRPVAASAVARFLTPAYAAPEQLLGEPETTATDVYALGVLLYQVLTGEMPSERDSGSLMELIARVSRETVGRPSAAVRAGCAGDERERRRLARRLEGDLDTIVLTALRREPERRYASAGALAEDLRLHLAGLPVRARAGGVRYRAGKFVARHRLGLVAATLMVVSLAGGLGSALWQARQARRAATFAEAQAVEALRRSQEALQRQLHADQENLAHSYLETAALLDRYGRWGEAEPLYRRALGVLRGRLGAHHPTVAGIERRLQGGEGLPRATGGAADRPPASRSAPPTQ